MMRSASFLALCVLCACVSLSAETVMISLENDEGSSYITKDRKELASAIVDGAMEQFFEADHIVFNSAFTHDEGATPEATRRVAILGGAGILLTLGVGETEPALLAPLYLRFSLSDLRADGVIAEGNVALDEVMAGNQKTALRACFLMGARAAAESIRIWSTRQ